MIAQTTTGRPDVASPSAGDQIENIVKTFGLTTEPNDIHGGDLRSQLLSSYIEWLEMERRLASTALWPQLPEGVTPRDKDGAVYACIPANTRWGDWHHSHFNFPAMRWCDRPHPVTRAALVLWAVGAIGDIPDPLRDMIAKLQIVEAELDGREDIDDDHQLVKNQDRLLRQLREAPPSPTTMLGASFALKFAVGELDKDADHTRLKAVVGAVIRFLERDDPAPSDGAAQTKPTVRPDDALWALESWREKRAAFDAFDESTPEDDPAFKAADDAEGLSWDRMIRVVPTTPAGMKAWTAVINEPANRERIGESAEIETVLDTMARAAAAIEERLS